MITSGALRMQDAGRDAAEIDMGRSTQPLVSHTQGSTSSYSDAHGNANTQYHEDAWVEPQRSTVLVVRWK